MQGVRSLGKKGGVPGTVFPLPGAPRKRCLDVSARVLHNSRTRGAPGRGVRAKKRLAVTAAPQANPTWRAQLWRGAPVPACWLSRWLCALRRPALAAFNRGLPRPRPRPAPSPSSVPPDSRSFSPPPPGTPPQFGLHLPLCPTSPGFPAQRLQQLPADPSLDRSAGPGAVHRVVLNPRALPLSTGAGVSQPPLPLSQTACRQEQGMRHWPGKVTELAE